jgi:hypothetical protein
MIITEAVQLTMDSDILRSLFILASRAVPVDYPIKIEMNKKKQAETSKE